MNVYLPRYVMTAQTKAIRIALNKAGHEVSYIGTCPEQPDRHGPRTVGATKHHEQDEAARQIEALEIVDRMLDEAPDGYVIANDGMFGEWNTWKDDDLGIIIGNGHATRRHAVAAAWAHHGKTAPQKTGAKWIGDEFTPHKVADREEL